MKHYSRSQLRQLVQSKFIQQIPDEIWSQVLDWDEPYDEKDVKDLFHSLSNLGYREKEIKQEVSNRDFIRSEILSASVEEEIKEFRREIFGVESPPFQTKGMMEKWISEEVEKQPPPEGFSDILSFLQENNNRRVVRLPDKGSLRILWILVQSIMEKINCHEIQATSYILLGEKPYLQTVTVTVNQSIIGTEFSKGEIIMKIRAPVSKVEIGSIYEKYRRLMWGNLRAGHEPTERDMEYIRFGYEHLNKDNPNWKEVWKKWNQEYPNYHHYRVTDFKKYFLRAWKKAFPELTPRNLFPKE